jgi:DNA-binding response OmpR family regulator
VVDDEEDTRALVSWVFRDLGFDVTVANDGWAAVEAIEARAPDLVVLDLVMPIAGWLVLEHARSIPNPPAVVVMTACGDSGSFARAVREGAAGYVFKPFRMAGLVATCERLLTGRSRSPEAAAERRREPRRVLALDLKADSEDRTTTTWGKLVDVSPSGAQLDLDAPLEPGERVRFAFQVPDGDTPLFSFEGRIQWRGSAVPGFPHGLSFDNVPADERRQLRELLCPS